MKNEFKKLNLDLNVIKSIELEGFKQPKEIQIKTLPLISSGYDIIANSPISSGKTSSYIIGLIQNLNKGIGISAIVLVSSDEQAKLIEKQFKLFNKNSGKGLKFSVTSGTAKSKEKIIKADIIISTTTKFKELINEKTYDFSKVNILVLDDVDKIFEVENFNHFNFILRNMPKKRQILVFSTTISPQVYLEIRYWMKAPKRINVE